MIQMSVDQNISGSVTSVGILDDAAGIFLDPSKKTVVRGGAWLGSPDLNGA